jgi:hypothetical protein
MRQVRFSHNYLKLDKAFTRGNMKAKLLQVIQIDYKDLSADFIAHDTVYRDGRIVGAYDLPRTILILLIFRSEAFHKIFMTLRRFTPSKWNYYKKSVGEIFEVKME